MSAGDGPARMLVAVLLASLVPVSHVRPPFNGGFHPTSFAPSHVCARTALPAVSVGVSARGVGPNNTPLRGHVVFQ